MLLIFQKDFIHWDGLLRVNGGKAIIPNVIKTVQAAWLRGTIYIEAQNSLELRFSS